MSVLFDSHAHLVSADTERYPPSPLTGQLDRILEPFTAEDLIRAMDEAGVSRAVAVQRAHVYGFNNAYVADVAAKYPERLVAVGMIDSLDPGAPNQVRHWVEDRGVIGIRMTEAVRGSGPAWVSGSIAQDIWATASELGASICFHFMRWNREECLTALKEMCARFPETKVVVDHFSNLVGEQGAPDFGVDSLMQDLAAFPNVFQKYTMINIAKLGDLGLSAAPVVSRVVQSYGADRVMWGSDVAQSKGKYSELVSLGQQASSLLSDADRRQVMFETGLAVYGRGL